MTDWNELAKALLAHENRVVQMVLALKDGVDAVNTAVVEVVDSRTNLWRQIREISDQEPDDR